LDAWTALCRMRPAPCHQLLAVGSPSVQVTRAVKNRQRLVRMSSCAHAYSSPCCHVDLFPICIKSVEQTRLIYSRIGLQLLKCCFRYKERPFHSPVMTPESNSESRGVKESALIGKVQHSCFTVGPGLLLIGAVSLPLS